MQRLSLDTSGRGLAGYADIVGAPIETMEEGKEGDEAEEDEDTTSELKGDGEEEEERQTAGRSVADGEEEVSAAYVVFCRQDGAEYSVAALHSRLQSSTARGAACSSTMRFPPYRCTHGPVQQY